MTRKKKTFGVEHFLGTYATTIGLQVFSLVFGMILARLLGAEGRGDYAAVMLWPGIIANCGLFGSRMSITRAVASSSCKSIVRAGLLLSLVLSVVSVLAAWALLPFLIPEDSHHLVEVARIYSVFYVPLFIFTSNIAAVDQGEGNLKRFNWCRFLQSPISLVLLILLACFDAVQLDNCVYALLLSYGIVFVMRGGMLLREFPLLGKVASIWQMLRSSVPYAVTGVLGQINHRGDRILLLWLLPGAEMGLYVVAYGVASIVAQAPRSIGLVVLTMAAQEGERKGYSMLARNFRMACVTGLLMAVVGGAVFYWLMPVLYGADFVFARWTMIILCVAFIPLGLNALLAQAMAGQGKPLAGTLTKIIGTMVMALVAWLLKDSMGLNGVALGFFAAQLVSLCGLMCLVVRYYDGGRMCDMVPRPEDLGLLVQRLTGLISKFIGRKATK